ncbi:hypothetical protein ES703_08246 [subsurface metagenome]
MQLDGGGYPRGQLELGIGFGIVFPGNGQGEQLLIGPVRDEEAHVTQKAADYRHRAAKAKVVNHVRLITIRPLLLAERFTSFHCMLPPEYILTLLRGNTGVLILLLFGNLGPAFERGNLVLFIISPGAGNSTAHSYVIVQKARQIPVLGIEE